MAASGTAQFDVHAYAQDGPDFTAAGVGLFELHLLA